MGSGEWLASCSLDIVTFYMHAEEACQLSPGNLKEQYAQLRVQEVIFGLCVEHDSLRDADAESGLVYFACAYAHRSGELLEGKFPSYHHAVYSLACDVVANIQARLESHPPDWTLLVEDLNQRAIEYEGLAEACDPLRNRLDQELAIAINLQTPTSQQVTRVATAGASAGGGATPLPQTETVHATGASEAHSTEAEEPAETTVTRAELLKRLTVDLKQNKVWFDKTPYDVSGDGAMLFHQMRKSYPKPISAYELFTKPSRVKNSLKTELQDLIRTDSGKGYWLELPPAAPDIRR